MSQHHRVLEVDRLSVIHRARGRRGLPVVACDEVSLSIAQGEIVGVVGESGSGKTSLAMAVAGLGRITSGTATVSGVQIGRRLPRESRAEIQVVFQDPHGSLDPRQTVQRGLKELRRIHPRRTSWIGDEELLAKVGLDPLLLGRLPHQMSGGQAQRISIARALLLRPSLLLADEPTSALDVSVQAQILRLLLSLREEEGLTILFISHDLAVVRAICDRVHVMLRGKVVEEGVTSEVFDRPQHEYTKRLLAAIPGHSTPDSTGDKAGASASVGATVAREAS
ncbi:ABC transporter ATP-binding protein [Dactylosporangium sp. CA-139066]|uniref:ABC transporter ATP-binding protein n=1 Tax=Dactylosporangium sp. CA-139066 TaxID=3239930 RepID=UPI003D92CCAB